MRHTLAAQGAVGAVMCAHCWQAAAGTLIPHPSRCLSDFLFLSPIRDKYFPSPFYLFEKCLIWRKQRFFFPDRLRGSGCGSIWDELPCRMLT